MIMKSIRIIYLLFALPAVIVAGCDEDCDVQPVVSYPAPFKHVTQGLGVEMHLYPADTCKVTYYNCRNAGVRMEVTDSTLYVEADLPGLFAGSYSPVKVYVGTPELNIIRNDGEQCIYSDETLPFEKLILKSEDTYGHLNTGDMKLDVESEWVQVISNGISKIEVSGTTQVLDLRYYNNVGRFEGQELKAQGVRIWHKGENTLTVYPLYYIRGEIFSMGDVVALNRPQIVDVTEYGEGHLTIVE